MIQLNPGRQRQLALFPLRGPALSALHQHCQDRLQMVVGEFLELVVGAVLDRVGNEH